MKVCAVIAEYNPMHSGHEYHLSQARKAGATHIVAVMSGNFVQRGDAAICSKWARAEAALECGADLVLELPVIYATATAQRFAYGAVETLSALGAVDMLCFGSECGDVNMIKEAARLLTEPEVVAEMKAHLANSESFATARQAALSCVSSAGSLLSNPNDTLAVEYVSALNALGSKIEPVAVKRIAVDHDAGENDGYASASYLRELIYAGDYGSLSEFMPEKSVELVRREIEKGRCPARLDKLDLTGVAILRKMSVEAMAQLPDISEGLENRLYKAVRESVSIEQIVARTKSKRCTHARVRRMLIHSLLGITDEIYSQKVPYIRVLGMNRKGKQVLAAAKPTLPIISRIKDTLTLDADAKNLFECESRADDIYELMLDCPSGCGSNFTNKIIIKQ